MVPLLSRVPRVGIGSSEVQGAAASQGECTIALMAPAPVKLLLCTSISSVTPLLITVALVMISPFAAPGGWHYRRLPGCRCRCVAVAQCQCAISEVVLRRSCWSGECHRSGSTHEQGTIG